MFDWLQFSPERLSNPFLILAICLSVVGMAGVLFFSGRLKNGKADAKITTIGIISAVVMLVGVVTAVLIA